MSHEILSHFKPHEIAKFAISGMAIPVALLGGGGQEMNINPGPLPVPPAATQPARPAAGLSPRQEERENKLRLLSGGEDEEKRPDPDDVNTPRNPKLALRLGEFVAHQDYPSELAKALPELAKRLMVKCKRCGKSFQAGIVDEASFWGTDLAMNAYECPQCGAVGSYWKTDHFFQ